MPGKRGQVRSQAQWRWMFATKQRFSHKWARARKAKYGKKTDYQTLPNRRSIRRR